MALIDKDLAHIQLYTRRNRLMNNEYEDYKKIDKLLEFCNNCFMFFIWLFLEKAQI